MDERQSQIRERAGLEESRLNEDFIEFLRKWGTPALMVLAIVAVGYLGLNKYKKARDEKIDKAFFDYEQVSGSNNPSPQSLTATAEEHEGVKAVSMLARRDAADA